MAKDQFVIGVDYGTDSIRSILVNANSGEELAISEFHYPRWADGLFCDASRNQFRQHPLDYIEGLEFTIKACLRHAGTQAAGSVRGISLDTTGSTPVAVNESGVPLSMLAGFEQNPNAMFVLWKDHSAVKEAEEINEHAKRYDTNYLKYVGGIYSSEWFWAKLLHVIRTDPAVQKACYSWVEHCDWIPFLLTGGSDVRKMKRSVCAAGHKALWSKSFDGLPPNEFFASLDPLLSGFTERLFKTTYTADQAAGQLSPEWADRLGLSTNVVVGIGAFDCHMGAVGGQIEPFHLSKVMGTSTCDMMVIPDEAMGNKLVKGICGQVEGSILPCMIGLEAGQSAFGDTYAWFREVLMWPIKNLLKKSANLSSDAADKLIEEVTHQMIPTLSSMAETLPLSDQDELAVDWLNGRRTPDADQNLKAAISGLSLGSDSPRIFKALVEATCFGARAIVNRFNNEGIPVKGVIGLGGVSRKSPYIMQTMADVLGMSIRIHKSEQTCAMGAAMFAATAARIHPGALEAMNVMGQGFDMTFTPNASREEHYRIRYEKYRELGFLVENSQRHEIEELSLH